MPQASVTAGGVGTTIAATHEAVAVVGGIAANGSTLDSNSMNISLGVAFTVGISPGISHVTFTSRRSAGNGTGNVGNRLPQASFTAGGVGTTMSATQEAVAVVLAGIAETVHAR